MEVVHARNLPRTTYLCHRQTRGVTRCQSRPRGVSPSHAITLVEPIHVQRDVELHHICLGHCRTCDAVQPALRCLQLLHGAADFLPSGIIAQDKRQAVLVQPPAHRAQP